MHVIQSACASASIGVIHNTRTIHTQASCRFLLSPPPVSALCLCRVRMQRNWHHSQGCNLRPAVAPCLTMPPLGYAACTLRPEYRCCLHQACNPACAAVGMCYRPCVCSDGCFSMALCECMPALPLHTTTVSVTAHTRTVQHVEHNARTMWCSAKPGSSTTASTWLPQCAHTVMSTSAHEIPQPSTPPWRARCMLQGSSQLSSAQVQHCMPCLALLATEASCRSMQLLPAANRMAPAPPAAWLACRRRSQGSGVRMCGTVPCCINADA